MRGAPADEVGEQRHARAALRRALDRADRFVARAQQRDAFAFDLAEIVEQVGEGALGGVGRRHDDEQRSAEVAVQRGEQRRPRGRDRFVQRVAARLSARQRAQRAQTLDRGVPRAAGFGEGGEQAAGRAGDGVAGNGCRRSYGPLIIAESEAAATSQRCRGQSGTAAAGTPTASGA